MAEYRLARRVGEVADRLQRLRTLKRRSVLWCAGCAGGLLLLAAILWSPSPVLSFPLITATGAVLLITGWRAARRPRPNLHEAAVAIEQRWPSLDSRLVTSVDQRPDEDAGGFGFLQHEVICESLLHAHRHDWAETVPRRELSRAKLLHLVSLSLFVGSFATAAWMAHARPASRDGSQLADASATAGATYDVTIEPGDALIERGTDILAIARFSGRMPREVVLNATDPAGKTTSLPFSRSLDDPLFGGRIPRVQTDLSYHVTIDGEPSQTYRIEVFDFPRLEQADVTIVSPDYTGMAEQTIEDVRRVSVAEGSRLTLACRFNKPVDEAVLQQDTGAALKLTTGDSPSRMVHTLTFTPSERQVFKLIAIDAEGRSNKHPPEFVFDVIPNQPPELAVAFPGKDVRVSPLEEVSLEASAQDDFGLKEYGLIYQLPDGDERLLTLGNGSEREGKVQFAHQLAMEDAKARPNELVAYYFYADDVGPDGDLRRTFSDLYFAEIRYFDEEYRQASSSQGQRGDMPANTPSSQLLQLQRDIVNAIWNLIRHERGEEPSAEFAEQSQTVADSQRRAIAMGHELQVTQEDMLQRQFLQQALDHMEMAAEFLVRAADVPSLEPLPEARRAAHEAYRDLVKLQAREHVVQQSQSSSQSQSDSSSSDLNRQLEQLELENNRNRYETEQQDQPPADREQLQVLSRLRELARRQEGLNDKIRELDNALRPAQAPQEREETERQLKRLQEEQQQLLRDLDELQERMQNDQNRSRLADAREQAKDVREHVRRSSEALKKGQTSRALAEGTRAERQLNEMKNELREQTAGQFEDALRGLRQESRELAERQRQIAEDLTGGPEPEVSGPPRLKDDESNDLHRQFSRQQERLEALMDRIEEVIRAAEASEPLLSKKLYDAVRDTRSDRPAEALAMAGQFLRHGLKQEAARAEAQARTGIETLQQGIEQAAANVLGDEVESLRRAQREIDGLSRAIASEFEQTTSEQTDESQQSPSESPDAKGGNSEPSQPEIEADQSEGHQTDEQKSGEQSPPETNGGRPPTSGERAGESTRSALSGFLPANETDGSGGGPQAGRAIRPLTGADFTQWSDRMRDIEEMVDDPDLRARVAQIRDRARQVRIDVKRHSATPDWDLVKTGIYGPMIELRDRLAEEILRREPSNEVVPLDRDPVPDRYADLVEQYYRQLGSGR